MRFAFVNPNWNFRGSTYFGCRDPHVPLELLFAADKVKEAGHESLVVDAQINSLSMADTRERVDAFDPDFLIIPSAPSYLFWRCPPPELRVPTEWFRGIGARAKKVLVGPHGSATPTTAMRKTGADIVIKGECDQVIADLASQPWDLLDGVCYRDQQGREHISPGLATVDMKTLGALDFKNYAVEKHAHRHHVFHGEGRGAELEFARGCPWNCSFCNKQLFRNKFRERDVDAVLLEIDRLIERGVDYIYFIDEIFGVGKNVRRLLEGIAERKVQIGFQTRIDLWNEETLDLLGRAHTISIECGIESITEDGREELNKNCRMTTERITELLIYAKQRIPWVQANLILTEKDNKIDIRKWQDHLKAHGVWVSEPVPMFPFPGSPLYVQTFGALPDDQAWERAHSYYTETFVKKGFSDIQEQEPLSIEELERSVAYAPDLGSQFPEKSKSKSPTRPLFWDMNLLGF
jgi:anaerobic magnesium-protoporphyrin IX monomethyl ester cyclase